MSESWKWAIEERQHGTFLLSNGGYPIAVLSSAGAGHIIDTAAKIADALNAHDRRASPASPTTEGRGEDTLVRRLDGRALFFEQAPWDASRSNLLKSADLFREAAREIERLRLLSSPRVEEVRREALEEAAARGMCRARILSNLIRDGRQEGQEWIQKAEDMGWEFYKWDASVAINRLEQDGYAFTKRSLSLPDGEGEEKLATRAEDGPTAPTDRL